MNSYRSHHSSGSDSADLVCVRDIYVEIIQLQAFGELNKIGWIHKWKHKNINVYFKHV